MGAELRRALSVGTKRGGKDLMQLKTALALEKSIAHWERLADNVRLKNDWGVTEWLYSEDCALCDLFLHNDCIGCPVHERTGRKGCAGFSEWQAAFRHGRKHAREQSFEFYEAAHAVAEALKAMRKPEA